MATITGDNNGQTLGGTSGDDTIDAQGGNDIIDLSHGTDAINGGTGLDTIRYVAAADEALHVNLPSGIYQVSLGATLHSGSLVGVERINVTGAGLVDYLWGGARADTIRGGGGDDHLSSGGGADSIVGGDGNDIICNRVFFYDYVEDFEALTASASRIDGGAGIDTVYVDLSAASAAQTIDLSQAAATLVLDGGLTLVSIEHFGLMRTGGGADTITLGNARGNVETGGGNDTVRVEAIGVDGDQTYNIFRVDGGGGSDTLVVDATSLSADGFVVANLSHVGFHEGGFSLSSTAILGFERLAATGGAGNDQLWGGAGNDTLIGGLGNDTIESGGGSDTLEGGEGDDTFRAIVAGVLAVDGGTGDDRASIDYSAIATGHVVDLSLAAGTLVLFGGATLTSIEGFDDFRTGNGRDEIRGTSGNDSIDAGGGNDTVHVSSGGDDLVGGTGTDTLVADFSALPASSPISGNLGYLGFGTDYVSVRSFEILRVTAGAGDDDITGGSLGDTLRGRGGNDTLHGGAGQDTIDGGDGADLVDGGWGTADMASYTDSSAAVSVDLIRNTATGTSQGSGDTLVSIENVTGSAYGDRITGNTLSNLLVGGGGNDVLRGWGGNDTLNGGLGNDTMYAHAGADVYEYTTASFGRDVIVGFEDGVDHLDFRSLGLTFASFTLGQNAAGDAVLTYTAAPSHTITFSGVGAALIDATDFLA